MLTSFGVGEKVVYETGFSKILKSGTVEKITARNGAVLGSSREDGAIRFNRVKSTRFLT